MENITNWISEHGVDWGIQIAIAIAIFIVGKIIARMISNLVEKGLTRAGTDKILVGFLGNMTYGILLIAVVLAAVDSLGGASSRSRRIWAPRFQCALAPA